MRTSSIAWCRVPQQPGRDRVAIPRSWCWCAPRVHLNCRCWPASLRQPVRYDAIVALGCVIRGDTAHFDFVAGQAARGIADAARDTGLPVIFGVLTTESLEQALERASTDRMDKGGEAMDAALEMVLVLRQIAAS